MSLVTVHLRWNDIGPEQYDRVVRAVSEAGKPPAGCLSTQLRRNGTALMATEVWDSEVAGNSMDRLVTTVREAGVEQRPQTAMFSVPEMYAVAYRRAAAPTTAIPRQPGPPDVERLAAHTTSATSTAG
jgi:uncharacterized protein YeaC (DUF1315 family)